jgi:hypothetical protein
MAKPDLQSGLLISHETESFKRNFFYFLTAAAQSTSNPTEVNDSGFMFSSAESPSFLMCKPWLLGDKRRA